LRAAARVPHALRIMVPLIGHVEEVRTVSVLLARYQDELRNEGLDVSDRVLLGAMIEVPAAAMIAEHLAEEVDFFSIGTNDLTQYTMAADRGNATLGPLQDALHPAVLRLIERVVAGADASGIPVAVCGELAADPAGALVLVGLGVDELSADAGALGEVRLALAACTRADLDGLARAALAAPDASTVRALAAGLLARTG